MSESLRDRLVREEGLELKPYKDSKGILTIGVGRNLEADGISKAEALLMLDNDINYASLVLQNALPWTDVLDWPRKSVLLDMAFNMGITKLLGFVHFLAAVQSKDWGTAQIEMLNSEWAREVGKRADDLSQIIITGILP